ncbi:GNAT family N-acetyltransferase [Thermophagus sp. OGC60D27]|uniref:GNAT family N-acetyltransferase n=1 Tax=Thermophagus sp. OGC60D27 TaxID=3458415 RepID=UPI0040378C0E
MELKNHHVTLREFRHSDADSIIQLINNRKIWDNVRDSLPFPYFEKDAHEFIDFCRKMDPPGTFAIEYKNEFVGTIGLEQKNDIYRMSAAIGYWLGEPYWNRGIATTAVNLMVDYGFNQLGLIRIDAGVFSYNKGSQRVLEKAGFKLEGIFEKAVIKNNTVCDEYRYAKIKNF